MAKKKHTQTVIAEHFGMDVQDVIDTRYQYGHTPIPMYAMGDNGLLAVSKSMPKWDDMKWRAIADVGDGRKIWESYSDDN